jgi:uncharacterized protein (TIGR03437 family)
MRCKVIFCLSLLSSIAWSQDRDLSITWIGQAGFILKTVGGPTVVTDPPAPSIGYTIPAVTADAVTITHNHADHNNSAGIGGAFTLVDGRPITARQEIAAAGTTFTLIPGFHDNTNGSQRGPNALIKWTQAGLKIAHLGDVGQDQLTEAQLTELRDLDILFIPAGGGPTISTERAAAFVAELRPRITILMHYRTPLGGPTSIASLPAAAAPFSPVIYKPSVVLVHRDALPVSREVWVMQPASDAVAVNAATFGEGQPVAPGSIASIFGTFTGSQTAPQTGYPLPRKIGDTEVLVDGKAVPLYYVSPAQVNIQLSATQAVGPALADIRVAGRTVGRAPLTIVPTAPGLFAVANQDFRANSAGTPARQGEVIQIYGTGLGVSTPAIDDGAAAPSQPPSTGVPPNVFLQGRQIPVQFTGLAPGFAGLWQVNAVLPNDAPTGPSIPLSIVSGGTSNTITIGIAQR